MTTSSIGNEFCRIEEFYATIINERAAILNSGDQDVRKCNLNQVVFKVAGWPQVRKSTQAMLSRLV